MPKRILVSTLAVLAVLVITNLLTSRSSHAERTANSCIAKPNSMLPEGSRWYYRVDRKTHRRCWYVGPKGMKVRQAALPKRLSMSKTKVKPAVVRAAEVPAIEALGAADGGGAENVKIVQEPKGPKGPKGPKEPATAFSLRWPELAKPTPSFRLVSTLISNSYAEEHGMAGSIDDMPLIWPVLTALEVAAVEMRSESDGRPSYGLGISLGLCILAFGAMVACMAIEFSGARRARRRPVHDHGRSRLDPTSDRHPLSSEQVAGTFLGPKITPRRASAAR